MNNLTINNSIPSFGTKLTYRVCHQFGPISTKTAKQIEDVFQKQTGNTDDELKVVYDKDITYNDVFNCFYTNKDHRDCISLTVSPEFSKMPFFVDNLEFVLSIFKKRESELNKIIKSISDYEENTVKSLKEIPSVEKVSSYTRLY